ncbi:hypothetical protein Metlim_1236 [Methanoplanus limicola DSM 2279]|uniref:Uncharacterized protein n=1 Tax=Methanoplanus limicola DSM 2279 TaxID=937775 RepID=H1Z179_9EURY|nr:hypothetical protein Metlim_1236 [Methanoplanus limicola DSM 2279]
MIARFFYNLADKCIKHPIISGFAGLFTLLGFSLALNGLQTLLNSIIWFIGIIQGIPFLSEGIIGSIIGFAILGVIVWYCKGNTP